MSDVDFQDLLSMEADDAVRPPAMPSGTYRVLIAENETIKSRDKGTPGVQFTFKNWEPMSDVDVDKWQEYASSPTIDKDQISRNETFWLTKKSMFRLKEFCVKAGAPEHGPMGKLIADAMKQSILVTMGQSVGKDGGVYNQIEGYAKDE